MFVRIAVILQSSEIATEPLRTTFATMDLCLGLNDNELDYIETEIGPLVRKVDKRVVDEVELA